MTTELDYAKADEYARAWLRVNPYVTNDGREINLAGCYLALRKENAWQPIETAVTDRDKDVLLYENGNIYIGRVISSVTSWSRGIYRTEIDHGDACATFYFPKGIIPTHWMPLPKAPDTHLGETR